MRDREASRGNLARLLVMTIGRVHEIDRHGVVTESRLSAYIAIATGTRLKEPDMSSLTVSNEQTTSATPSAAKVVQPAWVRILHWVNAFAMILMIMSGWQIYNASPLFGFTFSSSITLGGWLGGALLWHFAAMWI